MSIPLVMPSPSGYELKAARQKFNLTQVESAVLMGFSVQVGSRGRSHSSTSQAFKWSQLRDIPAIDWNTPAIQADAERIG